MPQGLQIWDANGVSVLDATTRAGLIIGNASTGVSDGSVTDSRLGFGTPFWFCTLKSFTVGDIPIIPIISFSGTTITWQFPPSYPNGKRKDCLISYGVR